MADAFRVCIIVPPGYAHAGCFVELAMSLKCALIDLGYDCDLKLNELCPDRITIVLGYHLLTWDPVLTSYRYIPWQLEQLCDRGTGLDDNLRLLLRGGCAVWDYSEKNIAFLAGHGIGARYLPAGYHPSLERIEAAGTQDIDVLFYGSPGGRRRPLIETLQGRRDLNTRFLFGVYGRERDELIARSKMVLNMHYYPAALFESVRVSYLLANGSFVLTEESADCPYPRVPLVTAALDAFENRIEHYLAESDERDAVRIGCRDAFRTYYPLAPLVAPLIAGGIRRF